MPPPASGGRIDVTQPYANLAFGAGSVKIVTDAATGGNSEEKQRVLKEIFGFDEFRPGQEQAVDALLAGRNVLSVMPTGSGKSLCF